MTMPEHPLAPLADQARRIAATARSGTSLARAARQLAKILDDAGCAEDARAAVVRIFDHQERANATRLLDSIEASHAAWGIEDIPSLVSIAWCQIRTRTLIGGPAEAEALAVLRAHIKQVAADVKRQLDGMAERVRAAEVAAAEDRARTFEQFHRKVERLGRDLTELRAADLSAGIDPHGFYVYLLWGDDTERPIYVGRSENILARLGTHMGDGGKRSRTRRITLVPCESYEQMCRYEDDLIYVYQPELNIAGVRAQGNGRLTA